ncbi:AAA family ATPase [Luteolibacter flavescens]|uniref:AAA family ATPase n=1 Tax=Luteolibacter flavescens TaxID=1859460 RepID=A0ABT3FLK8_9BACT|nr:AAA family ATPase [Luteolibacter flavescens]MCW1884074.1 AAA family ATPase [Luteolibacter flavescens]
MHPLPVSSPPRRNKRKKSSLLATAARIGQACPVLRSLHVCGYRSLRDFRVKFGRITVVTGENGVGKSNLYRALILLQRMAEGRFAEAVESESGMPGLMWAGLRRKDGPRRVSWEIEDDHFSFSHECGLIPTTPGDPTKFRTDPDVKTEVIRAGGIKGRPMAKRAGTSISVRGDDGKMETISLPFHLPESMLSEVRDGLRYPALTAVRETFLAWRFYHHFRVDPDSPLRRPRVGFWSPVLAGDGTNLAATLQSIAESGREAVLDQVVEKAFPGSRWRAVDDQGRFQLQLSRDELGRWLDASELSDGTLRFFCLCAALLTPKPPPLLVFNEPESSLHTSLLEPLADLMAAVPEETQLIVVTHARELAERIRERCEAKWVKLVSFEGETRLEGDAGSGRTWTFDD